MRSLLALWLLATLSWSGPLATADLNGFRAAGEQQLAALMRDRPLMRIQTGSPLWEWAALQFGGIKAGKPVRWDNQPPSDGLRAEHQLPTRAAPGLIRIRATYLHAPAVTKSFADSWSELIFELFNIGHRDHYHAIYQQLFAGELRKDQWLAAMAAVEHKALLDTQQFYRRYWQHWYPARASSPGWHRIRGVSADFGHWYQTRQLFSNYPEYPWGHWFDQQFKPWRQQQALTLPNPYAP